MLDGGDGGLSRGLGDAIDEEREAQVDDACHRFARTRDGLGVIDIERAAIALFEPESWNAGQSTTRMSRTTPRPMRAGRKASVHALASFGQRRVSKSSVHHWAPSRVEAKRVRCRCVIGGQGSRAGVT